MSIADRKFVQDAALFASTSYSTDSNAIQSTLQGNGWSVLSAPELPTQGIYFGATNYFSNFNAQAIVAQKGDTILLAFAGTNDILDALQDAASRIPSF